MIARKITRIIGITMIVVGLSVFFISYNQGVNSQYKYSTIGCAVDSRPGTCTTTNNEIISGFFGMIFSFFTALFGAYLVVPSALMKLIKRKRTGSIDEVD